jgi:hypothetical protein
LGVSGAARDAKRRDQSGEKDKSTTNDTYLLAH